MELIETCEAYLCLNMIVKNESHIIKDTLTKLLKMVPSIDYWVISDTGSTDKTKEIIIDFFKERNIKGEIFDDEWKDFGHNRTKALEHAFGKSKYLLVFDADDEICGDFVLPELKLDSYHLLFGDENGTSYTRTQIVNNKKKWKYVGVLHEMITCTEDTNGMDIINGKYYTISGKTGHRSRDQNKYLNDALILAKAYDEAVKNNDEIYHRYGFYCANSYYDSAKWEDAIKWYKITLDNKNWSQEKYVSCLRLYNCYNLLNQKETGIFYLVKAFSYDKERVECLTELVCYYCCNDMNDVANGYYTIVKSFYNEKFLTDNLNNKLFLDVSKANLFLPYYMILVSDKVKDYETTIQMYRIIFTKKHIERSKHYIGNMLYNLQFFIEVVKNDNTFLQLFKDYVDFLISINYPIYDHDFMEKYEKYGVFLPKIFEPTFSLDECYKSNKILIYTGYSPFKWNYTFSLNNALGGSETAIASLAKSFPENYEIFVTGNVIEENIDNVTYVNDDKLKELIKTTPFHTIIVSRYLNFYELYKNFSAYQTYIWGHDITLFSYGVDVSAENILTKWTSKITGCVCQTEWHKNLFLSLFPQLTDKIFIINNGINTNLFNSKDIMEVKKIPNRFIYTSCSERGLLKLTQLWTSILENLPNAELIISSYNTFPNSEEDNKIFDFIKKNPSIKHRGKLNRTELYELMSTAEYWLYPSYFQETSCITSLELLASEVICLYYPIAGLVNTVGDYGIRISEGNEVDTLLNYELLHNKTELKRKGKEYAFSCSWKNRAIEWCNLFFSKEYTPVINEPDQSVENYTIKIINLNKRTDRREKMKTKLKNLHINKYDFFEAIDGKELTPTPELLSLFKMNDFNYKKGVMGCALSHIHLWNNLINDKDNDFYVILEDDIVFSNNFKKHLNVVCKLFVEQKLEHLALGEYHSSKQFPSLDSTIEVYSKDLYKEWNCFFSYIISKDAAKKTINYINNCSIKCAIDNPQAFGYILKYSSLNKKLVHCDIINEFGSDIQNDNNNNNNFIVSPSQNKELLTVSFCDWWQNEYCGGIFDTNNNFFINLLREHGDNYEIKIVNQNENPDILFYSIFGNSHIHHKAGRKVFFSGEPYGQRENADFNITFDTNSYTNTRLPLWLCYFSNSLLDESKKRKNNTNVIPNREKFCSFVATGPGLANNRQVFVEKLSKYKQVDCGGSFLNNIGYNVPLGLNCSGKIEHNNNYKFAMAFESTVYPGYVTEKICDVFKSNCIPIYWGHPDVVKDFNPSSFINANDFTNFDDLVEYIIKVDTDEQLYKSFFKSPILSPKWSDILTDPNKTFFKNLADRIIGKNENLFNNLYKNNMANTEILEYKCNENYNSNLWIMYAFDGHNFKVIEDYINSLKQNYNIVYTQDINYVLSCNPKKISYLMYIKDDRIINKYKNTTVELSFFNTEPLSISYNLDLLKGYINKYPYLKIYDYSFSNLQIILNNNMYGELLEYKLCEKENLLLKELLINEIKIYDFGIITYGNTETNTVDNSLFHKKKDVVNEIISKGFKIHIISGWGIERDIELAKCKVILNIHSILGINGQMYYSKTFENIRCNRLLEAGFKILSEDSIHCNEITSKYRENLKFINYDDFKNIEYSEDFWDKIDNKNKIKKYCFIHSCNIENVGTYRLDYLVNKLNISGCVNIFEKIYINNTGLPIENIYGEKYQVINYSEDTQLFETPTINLIKDFSQINPNCYILYLHTKGVSYSNEDEKVNDWINYMLYFLVEKFRICTTLLDNNYDTIGCNYSNDLDKECFKYTHPFPPPHYNGNFWWANSNYLRSLPSLPMDKIERNAPEFWLFKNNHVFCNLHSSNVNHYHSLYPNNRYS